MLSINKSFVQFVHMIIFYTANEECKYTIKHAQNIKVTTISYLNFYMFNSSKVDLIYRYTIELITYTIPNSILMRNIPLKGDLLIAVP